MQFVLAEYLQFAVQFVPLARQNHIRFYAHAHGQDCSAFLRQESWRARYQGLREASGVIVVSKRMARALEEIGVPGRIIHRVPCGVDPLEFSRRPDRSTKLRFLSVGRLTGKKGPLFLLDSFRRAVERHPQIELHIVGDGELAEAVLQFIDLFSLHDNVQLYGALDHDTVLDLVRSCDVFVQHSVMSSNGDEEGLPVAVLEAMAGGLPVIATKHAGIPEAVIDGLTGFLVPEKDTCAMADRMCILVQNYEMRLEMGHQGLLRVKAEFTWNHERELLLNLMGAASGLDT